MHCGPTIFTIFGGHDPRGSRSSAPHVQLLSVRNDLCTALLVHCTRFEIITRTARGLEWIAAISEVMAG